MPAQFKNDAVLRLVVLLWREGHCRNIGAGRSAGFTHPILVPGLAGVAGGIIIVSMVRRRRDQHAVAVDVDIGRGRPAPGKTHRIYSIHPALCGAECERMIQLRAAQENAIESPRHQHLA